MKRLMLALAFSFAAISMADAAGDPAKGEKVFRICSACHTADAATNRVGAYVKGVVGRKSAAAEGYTDSPAMKAKGDGGLVWSESSLDAYLADPRGFVPNNKMAFAGLKKPDDRADVIAYLKTKL